MKDDFNKDDKDGNDIFNKPLQDITEKDLLDKIELMKSVAPELEQSVGMDKYRHAYFEKKESFEATLQTRDANFIMGQRRGLHPNMTFDNLHQQDNDKQAEMRKETFREVKIEYHQTYSISKSFGEVSKDKPKDKGMDMDKG